MRLAYLLVLKTMYSEVAKSDFGEIFCKVTGTGFKIGHTS